MAAQTHAIPPPVLNGGLYTGTPFFAGAPWRNFPALPDAGYMTFVNLMSAAPPPNARYHFAGGSLRPGNNTPQLPAQYVNTHRPDTNMLCVPAETDGHGHDHDHDHDHDHENRGFVGHYYL